MFGVTLTEPEQPKSGTVDQKYLSSRWETMTGEGGRLDIIDYICPHCHRNVFWQLWNANRCPHCDTPIFSAPRRKLDAKQYRNWRYDSFMEELHHADIRRAPGIATEHKAAHKRRAFASAERQGKA